VSESVTNRHLAERLAAYATRREMSTEAAIEELLDQALAPESAPVDVPGAARWCMARGLLFRQGERLEPTVNGMTVGLVLSEAYMRLYADPVEE
jgi:plasmid stability protein